MSLHIFPGAHVVVSVLMRHSSNACNLPRLIHNRVRKSYVHPVPSICFRTTGANVDPATTAPTIAGEHSAPSLSGETLARGRASSNGPSSWERATVVHEGWEVDPAAQDEAEVGKGSRIIGMRYS